MKFRKFLVFGIVLFMCAAQSVYAQEEEVVVTLSPTPAVQTVAYTLPHPGVLPGHLLYAVKAMRDSLMGFLVSNPLKKAEFDLLQADKHVQASYLLIVGDEKKVVLASQSFNKAEVYFTEALKKTDDAKKQGLDTSDIAKRLVLSNAKHKEILLVIEKGMTEKEKKQFEKQKAVLEDLGKNVKQIAK